jgi:uncharacterized protein YegP (UPF0339 family)
VHPTPAGQLLGDNTDVYERAISGSALARREKRAETERRRRPDRVSSRASGCPAASCDEQEGDCVDQKELTVAGKFELFKDSAGKFRFRLKARNGEIIATSEAYETKTKAKNGIKSVQNNAPTAAIDDQT